MLPSPQSSSRSKRGRRPSGWTMVSVCMRCAFLIYLKMNISWFLFWSAWGLRQGCDGGHPRHVGKHAVGFKVTLKMASFDELLQSTSFTLFVCFRLLGLSFGCRLSLPWPNRRIRVIAPYSQPLKGYVSRLLRISGIACCKQIHFREDGRGRKYANNSLWPPVPQPEPDQELLAELCRLPPLPEDQGGAVRVNRWMHLRVIAGWGVWALQVLWEEL